MHEAMGSIPTLSTHAYTDIDKHTYSGVEGGGVEGGRTDRKGKLYLTLRTQKQHTRHLFTFPVLAGGVS